jgi:large subunit ribosomal protein L25
MQELELKEREARKGNNNKLRRDGFIPGVIYGGDSNQSIYAEYKEFLKVFRKAGEHELVNVKVGKKKILTLIRDFQVDPLKDTFIHFDLFEVVPNKVIKTRIPVHANGTAKGVKAGGVLEEQQDHVYIESKAKDLPASIEVDVTDLEVGDSLHVRDLQVPKGVTILEDPDAVILLVSGVKAEAELTAPVEASEVPEVSESKE